MMTKAERTKKFIIETAAPIYNEKGIAGTNVDDVLEATKLTKGAIYSHFKNKDDLSMQVTDYLLEKITVGADQAMSKGNTAKEKIFAYLDFNAEPLKPILKAAARSLIWRWKLTIIIPVLNLKSASFMEYAKPFCSYFARGHQER